MDIYYNYDFLSVAESAIRIKQCGDSSAGRTIAEN